MTPYHLRVAASAYSEKIQNQHKRDLCIAWHTSVLHRAAKLPPLESLFEEKPSQQTVAEQLIHHFKMHNAQIKANEKIE